MRKNRLRHIASKWLRTKALLGNSSIRPHLPLTKIMTKQNLRSMLKAYQLVYIKPDLGAGGKGVIRVEWYKEETEYPYRYQFGKQTRKFSNFEALYGSLQKIKVKDIYLIQKGIHLLKRNHRPFDIRVMIQQNPKGKWETTGMVGRIAEPRKIVTNRSNGGSILSVNYLLQPYTTKEQRKKLIHTMYRLSWEISQQFQRKYPGIKEIGVDIGLDDNLKPWVIEVNTLPDSRLFDQLKDKTMIRKIIRYSSFYGRTINLKTARKTNNP